MKTTILAILALGWALTAAAQDPEEHARLDGVEARMAAIPTRARDLARERLIEAVTAMQSKLPDSPAELEAVFRAPNCYFHYPSSHRTTTTICLFEGTPFGALRRFVHVVDGVIRARGGLRIGRDEMTQFFSRHRCFLPSYSNATLRNRVEGMVFGSIAGRKSLRWKRQSMRNSIVGTLYGSLQRLPHLGELPRIAASSMGSTRGGNSSKWSPVTVAGVYVAHLAWIIHEGRA